MKNYKVNVLGTEYKIEFSNTANSPLLKNCYGYMDKTTKKIIIGEKELDCELEDFEAHQRHVLRHEVIHAFFEESGLSDCVENRELGVPETYVDWFAAQSPKIFTAFAELDVLFDFSCMVTVNKTNHGNDYAKRGKESHV